MSSNPAQSRPLVPVPVAAVAESAVNRLLNDYVAELDEDRLESWPELFVEDGLYRIVSRENVSLGLPAPLVYYYSRGMMRDRVTAIRDALTYEFVYTRHIVSAARIAQSSGGHLEAASNFAIYHSTEEGVSRLYCVGRYDDEIVLAEDGPRFRSRTVLIDTFGVPNLIALPL